MKVVCPSDPVLQEYGPPLASPINKKSERKIFDSMQATLEKCDALWIDLGGNLFQPVRRKSELLEVERLVPADGRRVTSGGGFPK